jgi:ketosteroid isomerase-like protein
MKSEFLETFCEKWLVAWNSHDTNEVLALLHDDIVWEDLTFWPNVIEGIEGVRVYVDKIWEVMHDVKFSEIQQFYAPDYSRALVLFNQSGSAPIKARQQGSFETHGCDIFMEFKDGKLKRYLSSYDIVDMMRQLEILPPRNGKIGGAYLASLLG